MLLRVLGLWLTIDAVGSVCLRYRNLKSYRNPRHALELTFRLVRLVIGVSLVMLG